MTTILLNSLAQLEHSISILCHFLFETAEPNAKEYRAVFEKSSRIATPVRRAGELGVLNKNCRHLAFNYIKGVS